MRIFGVIPARYASTRFPGKPLHPIAGIPLVLRVVAQCRKAKSLAEVIVATDDQRIAEAVRPFASVALTSPDHPSGTDRIAEVARQRPADAYLNIQGDEPLMDPNVVNAVAALLEKSEMATAATPLRDLADYDNPNVVKVVLNRDGEALYFSRRTIPYLRDQAAQPGGMQMAAFPFLKHLGIYGYRSALLQRLVHFPVSPLEQAERLEQLRALENGIRIAVARVEHEGIGVDVPADVPRVEAMLARQHA